jgi:hypothetical protein
MGLQFQVIDLLSLTLFNVFLIYYLIIPASFCHLAVVESIFSMIGFLSDTPAAFEANDNDSLICDFAF